MNTSTPQTYNDSHNIQYELKFDKEIQNFLERRNFETYNVTKQFSIEYNEDMEWVQISHISYDRSKDESDLHLIDFQQLLSAIASKSKKIVYRIESGENGINLYLGTLEDKKNIERNSSFLKNTFEGIYSGSSTVEVKPSFLTMPHSKAMLGIPSLKRDSDKEYKQSLEKILFPLQGKRFNIILIAESYTTDTIREIISNYQSLGNEIHKLAKQSKNLQQSDSIAEGITFNIGESFTTTETPTILKKGVSFIRDVVTFFSEYEDGDLWAVFEEDGKTSKRNIDLNSKQHIQNFKTTEASKASTETKGEGTTNTTSTTKTIGITFDEIDKSAEYCEKLVDKYIERFQKGLNHGMWNSALYIQSDDEVVLSELEHTLKSVYSGDETYFESIRFSENFGEHSDVDLSKLPMLYFDKSIVHPIHNSFAGFSSAINTEELSILTALPSNDVDGISVSKISSFGLTQSKVIDTNKSITIGKVLNKKKPTNQTFKLSTEALNSHLFVSGITGGGKSNTIKLILKELQLKTTLDRKIPFLVIEPAKSEYKHLLNDLPDLQIFRPGAQEDVFRFNPFVFEHSRKNKKLTKHVDMLKTTFNSAFPMYGPMPYILEEAIHKVYKDKGWNFETEDHPFFTESKDADYDRKSLLFPNMEDLKQAVVDVVDQAGYYQDLQNNIKAALKTRINNLTIGTKGKIFNSRHAFDSNILFEKPTIIELSNIIDDEEKAFLMGLLLNKLYQYREEKRMQHELQHITVIEEAHRLLPNISLDKSGEEASSRAKAIETFTNILSEIRAYGEGIIIADQIASKLNRDVIKNTNIKIIHRTMDYEDREIVGKSINLSDDQILDIAELKAGEAIVHNQDIHQAFMVKIDACNVPSIADEKIEQFNAKFIENHKNYQYELIDENDFLCEKCQSNSLHDINTDKECRYISLHDINTDSVKLSLLDLISATLFAPEKIQQRWNTFKQKIAPTPKHDRAYMYIALKSWLNLNYLSNMHYYNNIDAYLDSYRSFLRLLIALDKKSENLSKQIERFKESFFHENIKRLFPSMKDYSTQEVDYTLLILETMTADEDIFLYVNTTMKEELSLNERFDKILLKMFNTTSPALRHSLGSIRCGKKEIDLHAIVKQGF